MSDLVRDFRSTYLAAPNPVHQLASQLVAIGKAIGPFLPWHTSSDPYHWLVAELLLRRTTRTAVHRAFSSLVERFPDWETLSLGSEAEIAERIAWLGLGTQRSRQLRSLAAAVLGRPGGEVPRAREELITLPGVGDYIADAVRLHAFALPGFPLDPNVQRVIRRVYGLPTPISTRYNTPYSDPVAVGFAQQLLKSLPVEDLQNAHRGLLHVAWTNCRPVAHCPGCALLDICDFGRRAIPAALGDA